MKHYLNHKNYARTPDNWELPSLIDIQLKSFDDFLYGGKLLELFDEINPIQSFNKNLSLFFPGSHETAREFNLSLRYEDPKYDVDACIDRDVSYATPLYAQVALVNHEQGDEIIRQDIFLGEFPLMTSNGTFIINGTERVVVSQLIRSPGVYFDTEIEKASGRSLATAKLIPDRGAWMEFETRKTDLIALKFNRKKTIPVTILLRALAAVDDGMPPKSSPIRTGEDDEILTLFADVDTEEAHQYIRACFDAEPDWEELKKKYRSDSIADAALIEFYSRMRPGDPPTRANARDYLVGQLFDKRRYDLERVGRYKLNQRLGHDDSIDLEQRTLTKADLVKLVAELIRINIVANEGAGAFSRDDIDHLGNRRVKTVGELIGNKLRIGLRRMERVVKERMSIREADNLTPVNLVNIRPIVAAVREFFGSSQLSQFMEQTNPLSELTHKRTLSALGPGGLRRERAGFEVRDVHHSHYGRICPIETPEGPNIGLIGRLASYARVNELGFIETRYRKVLTELDLEDPRLPGRLIGADVEDTLQAELGAVIDEALLARLLLFSDALGDLPILTRKDNFTVLSARIAELSAAEALSLSQERFDTFARKIEDDTAGEANAEDGMSVYQRIHALRLTGTSTDAAQLKQYARLVQNRLQELSEVFGEYSQARAALREAASQMLQLDGLESELEQAASQKLQGASKQDAVLEDLVQEFSLLKAQVLKDSADPHDKVLKHLNNSLRNLFNALAEIVDQYDDGQEIPKNLRDRVHKWGKELLTFHERMEALRAEQAAADEALAKLAAADAFSGDFVRQRPISSDLLGERLGASLDCEIVVLDAGERIDAAAIDLLRQHGKNTVPVKPFATDETEYLSADREDQFFIAQANSVLDEKGQFVSRRVSARYQQGFRAASPRQVAYMDIAPRQPVGIAAALVPFLSHDAANRALMGSNMQRQAVPLISPDVSVVSTGMERQAASNSGQVLVYPYDDEAEVISVQGHRVIARVKDGGAMREETFALRKYERSNQSTCIDQRPLVRKGDILKRGDVIADSSSTFDGMLALGHDVLTCFLSWDGGNYEDALLVGEGMLRDDKFTSIHIEKHEIEARDTKLGAEEITYDIPNVGEEALRYLDADGIVRIGAEVGPNDILVGKITPKGEKELSPEEKLLRAIFGEQAREVRDSSLRLPHGDRGKVIDVKVFTRAEHPDLPAGVEKMVRVSVAQRRKLTVGDKMAGRHGNKGVISKIVSLEDMPYIEGGIPVEIILNPLGVPSRMNIGQILELHLGWAADRLGFRAITPVFDGVKEHEIQAELGRAWLIDWAWKLTTERALENQERLAAMIGIEAEDFDDDMSVIVAYLTERIGEPFAYGLTSFTDEIDPGHAQKVYARREAVADILREHGYDPDEIMVYDNAGLTMEERDARDANALDVSIRLWIQAKSPEPIELAADLSTKELFAIADRLMFQTGAPVPHYGKVTLYDGRTGEPFDRPVAVGYVHMLKLAHLVEDKAHARSTGPYSLVTQQPLGGKAQFGGQRFGEMEVWALEAYGAAHILQEMLTVKSDDVQGRVKTYESIVKGEPIEEPGIPTSFRVLVKELQSLGLSVEAITGSGDVIRFGKYDEQMRRPQPETGLLSLGAG